jgi:DNA primase
MNISRSDAYRLVQSKELSIDDVILGLEDQINKVDDIIEFDQSIIDSCSSRLWTPDGKPGLDYMNGRGFTDDTLKHFGVGYSQRQASVTVPVHSSKGVPMGFIGRSIKDKRFLNSSGLQGRKTVFNIHRAKKYGSTLIVVEASFDAMKIHQAGYPNVGALFKGTVTKEQSSIISGMFSEIVIFVDNDDPKDYPQLKEPPGVALAKKLRAIFSSTMLVKKVPFDRYSDLKDATDMSDDQINYALSGADLMLFDTDL